MDFKPYPNYKDSGVEWLGEVPEHWGISSIKRLSSITTGNRDSIHVEDDGKYPFFLRSKKIEKINSYSFDGEAVLTAGDGDVGEIVHYINGKFDFHQRVYMMSNFKKVQGRFFYYYFYSLFKKVAKDGRAKTTVDSLRKSHFDNFFMTIPELQEQNQIVSFLDSETSRIDNLIAKQEKLIEKLEEHRKSVISHAVTKGLDPNVPMKDSGVEWLGEVPEHWILKKYKFACKIYRGKFGHRPRNDPAFYDGEYPFIQTGDIARANKFIEKYSQTLNELGKSVSQKFPKGTLVMAIAANIGDTAILDFEAYAPDSVVGFKPNKDIDLEFLRFSFTSSLQALKQTSVQSTQSNLNVERIGALKAVFPPFEEQVEISNYLNNENLRIDDLILKQNQLIEKLKEHRTSIISYAVTGKIDVRDLVA